MLPIEIEALSFTYPDQPQPVLSNINLQIKAGDFVAIVGHNSSGKSTLARLIAGVYYPTLGQVRIGELIHLADPEADTSAAFRRQSGLVMQNPDHQIVGITVEEDIAFGLENIGVPTAEMRPRIQQSLAAVSLLGFEQKKPHQLSGGQKQRLAIAAVLAMDPAVLIFDEATTLLDPAGAAAVHQLIRKLHQLGHTIIYITHFMEEALTADLVVVLDQGRVKRSGSPQQIFSDHKLLKSCGLEAPFYAQLAASLRAQGARLPANIFTASQLKSELHKSGFRLKQRVKYPVFAGGEAIISVRNLSFTYDRISSEPVLKELDFELCAGQVTGLVGASGAGKSTLIQLLKGLLPGYKGQIALGGRELKSYAPIELCRQVGMVFQFPEDQIFEDTIEKEMLYGLRNIGVSAGECAARCTRALQFVQLDYQRLRHLSPFMLSGGFKRRLAIASILAMEPKILILDEPTAGLDPLMRRILLAQLFELQRQNGLTVIIISHHLDDIFPYVDNYLVLEAGALIYAGGGKKLFSDPQLLERGGLCLPHILEIEQLFG